MSDKIARMTTKEMRMLESVESNMAPTPKKGDALIDALELLDHLEEQKEKLEARDQIKIDAKLSERTADIIAKFSGSIIFVLLHILWFGLWLLLNTEPQLFGISSFDPYPYGFLTMTVSLEAIFLSTFILISQNRQSTHDRYRDEIDFERDRLDLKVDTLAAKTIREATIKITKIEQELAIINAKLDILTKNGKKKK